MQPIQILTAGTGLPEERAKQVAEAAAPACVSIRASGLLNPMLGSGFQIRDGFIVTAKHVVDPFLFQGELMPFTTIKVSPLTGQSKSFEVPLERVVDNYDLAFLGYISELDDLMLGRADDLAVGDPVLVLASPGTIEEPLLPYAGLGQVHSTSTTTPATFRYTVPILGGSSGGAILNMDGQVVGINLLRQSIGGTLYGVGLKAEAIKAALEGRMYMPSPVVYEPSQILVPVALGIGAGLLIVALSRR